MDLMDLKEKLKPQKERLDLIEGVLLHYGILLQSVLINLVKKMAPGEERTVFLDQIKILEDLKQSNIKQSPRLKPEKTKP